MELTYKNLIVAGCSFSTGTNLPEKFNNTPKTWSHFLVNKYLTSVNCYINLGILGGGNTQIAKSVIYTLEKINLNPNETLVLFNITGLQRIDLMCQLEQPDHNEYFSWKNMYNFSYINIPHLNSTDTIFKDLLHKNLGYDQVLLSNSIELISLFNYLKSKKIDYKFMLLDDTIEERSPDILNPYLKEAIKFDGLNMHEYCKKNNLLHDDGFHPSADGYSVLSDFIYQSLTA